MTQKVGSKSPIEIGQKPQIAVKVERARATRLKLFSGQGNRVHGNNLKTKE